MIHLVWLYTAAAQQLTPLPHVSFALPGETAPVGVAAADFDGNGAIDLAWSQGRQGLVAISYATSPGTFQPPIPLDPGAMTVVGGWLAAGDADGDGYGDLFTTTLGPERATSGWAGGPGGLLLPTWSLAGGDALAFLGDVDGSGVGDLSVGLAVWLGGGGGPTIGPTLPGALVYPYSTPTPVGDVDGDGRVDLYVPDYVPAGSYFDGIDGPASLVRDDGSGAVVLWTLDQGLGTGLLAVSADLNGDNLAEIVSVDASRSDDAFFGGMSVLTDLANPAGPTSLNSTPLALDIGQGLVLAALDDEDGDGDQTVLLGHHGVIRELTWLPFAGFDLVTFPRTWGHPSRTVHAVLTVDLDGDGLRDIVGAFSEEYSGDAEIAVWLTSPPPPVDTADTGYFYSDEWTDTGERRGPRAEDGEEEPDPSRYEAPGGGGGSGLCGCSSARPGAAVTWTLALVLVLRRRRGFEPR